MRTMLALHLACLSLGACATTGAPYRQPIGLGREPLYAYEMRSTPLLTAYDAVERLRPMYLHERGPGTRLATGGMRVLVFLNDMPMGGVEVLRTIPASEVASIRYLSAPEATVRYGSRAGGGAIVVSVGR
jgi:hypothetical protein